MALGIIKPPGNLGNRQNYLLSARGFVGSRPPRASETRASTDGGRTTGVSRIPDHRGVSSSWPGSTRPSMSHRPKGVSPLPEDIVDYPNAWVN
jgi:hypothetical protein